MINTDYRFNKLNDDGTYNYHVYGENGRLKTLSIPAGGESLDRMDRDSRNKDDYWEQNLDQGTETLKRRQDDPADSYNFDPVQMAAEKYGHKGRGANPKTGQLYDIVHDIILTLSEKEQDLYFSHYGEDITAAELARRYNVHRSTTGRNITKLGKVVAEILADKYGIDDSNIADFF